MEKRMETTGIIGVYRDYKLQRCIGIINYKA